MVDDENPDGYDGTETDAVRSPKREGFLTDERREKLGDLGIAVGLAVGGMGVGLVATVIVISVVAVADLGLSDTARNIVLMLPLQIGGLAGTAVAFLWITDRGFGYVRLRKPSLKHLGIAFGSIFAMLAAVVAVTVVIESLGQQAADHATTQQIESDPRLALYMVPLALLVIGPCEELLFRGVIQTKLTESFGTRGGVVVASVVFSAVHVPSYGGLSAGLNQLAITLGVLFSLAIILGAVYEKTDNLAVPIVAHGFYNAVLFGITYIGTQYADELEQATAVL
ncbi:MAG: membrane protease YdiL (CAAX protease family) [Methanobacteriota archaeon]|jgi:membrane protease YdiL (CAAX protease family)|uniref:CPBP family intramembrane metalloprotease n=1 Tax=Halorutilus salinus TaxID=2487751 RepID=A0A9Q4GHI2_9EURY|nr:CPBP family intramembrane glutamic endopeptidase [Halorutilus salinus]MCX2819922.1 CPBP family intramembrane metalloprotease [Halorutilus salinus]